MSRLIHMGQRLKQILKQRKIKIVDFADMAGFTNQIAHYHLRKSDMKRSTVRSSISRRRNSMNGTVFLSLMAKSLLHLQYYIMVTD